MEKETIMFLNALHEGLTIADKDGTLVYINDSAAEIFGIDKNEALGKNMDYYESRGIFSPSITKMVIEQKTTVKAMQKDANGREILGTGVPVYDDGELKYIVCFSAWEFFLPSDIVEKYEALKVHSARLEREIKSLRMSSRINSEIVAESRIMQDNVKLITKVADVKIPVFIWGEESCGKRSLAMAMHKISKWSEEAVETINCSLFSDEIIEKTFFGSDGEKGIAETVGNGLVIIENIERLSKYMQFKIKKCIDEGKIKVAAISEYSLDELYNNEKIIPELYHCLSVINIEIPPLRERVDDLREYINMYLKKFNEKYDRNTFFSPKAYSALYKYVWKGNISQVKAVIERIVLTSESDRIDVYNLPKEISINSNENFKERYSLKEEIEAFEKEIVIHTYEANKTTVAVAKALGISQASAVRKLQKYIEGYGN